MGQPYCIKCGYPVNMKREQYIAHSYNGKTEYMHRPCPTITLDEMRKVQNLASGIIRYAQVMARKAIVETNAIIYRELHHD